MMTSVNVDASDAFIQWFMIGKDEWYVSVQTGSASEHANLTVINRVGDVAKRIYIESDLESRTWKQYDSFNCKDSVNRMSDYTRGNPVMWKPNNRDKFDDLRRALAYRRAIKMMRDAG